MGESYGGALRRVRAALLEAQNHRCAYCGVDIRTGATFDHVIPRSRGGAVNDPDNVVMACYGCNQQRGSTDAYEFFALKQDLAAMNREMAASFHRMLEAVRR